MRKQRTSTPWPPLDDGGGRFFARCLPRSQDWGILVEMTHNAPAHTEMAHTRQQAPGVGEQQRDPGRARGRGLGDLPHPTPSRAEREDDLMRRRWMRGGKMRSPYWSLLEMPRTVAPGDHAAALAILGRVEAVLAIKSGRWTKSERRRLREMRDAWERRASGDNPMFNMSGWSGGGAANQWWAAQDPQIKKVSRAIEDIRRGLK